MKDWNRYLKLGIVHFMAFPETIKGEGPILETVTKIAEDDFFTAIELTRIKDPDTRRKVRDIVKSAYLSIGFGIQPPLLMGKFNLNSFDGEERKKAIDFVKTCIDEAAEIESPRLALLSGSHPGYDKKDEAFKLLVDSLDEICTYGESRGNTGITLETFDTDIEKRCLMGPAEEAAALARELKKKHPSFGIMYDLSHAPQLNEDPSVALGVLKEHLVHAHVGNCILKDKSHPAYGDQHPRFSIENGENGVIELKKFLESLFKVGYLKEGKQPIVSFEVKPIAGESSSVVIGNAKRTWREAWSSLSI